jgi:hypothetical protein
MLKYPLAQKLTTSGHQNYKKIIFPLLRLNAPAITTTAAVLLNCLAGSSRVVYDILDTMYIERRVREETYAHYQQYNEWEC